MKYSQHKMNNDLKASLDNCRAGAAFRPWRIVFAGLLLASLSLAPASVEAASTGTTGTVSAAAAPGSSRMTAYTAYQDVLKPALAVPIGWTGSTAGCVAGAPSPQAQSATLTAVNYYRDLAQLPRVTFDPTLSAKAQDMALMMYAQNDIRHDPPPTWACYTAAGRAGAESSNLYLGRTGADAVAGYMEDPGSFNNFVGHRRWILYPPQVTMGSGSTSGSNALYVQGAQAAPSPPPPAWVPWPTPGYVPFQVEPTGRWSLSASNSTTDFSGARVSVTSGGVQVPVTVQPVMVGYGSPTLVWQLDPGYGLGRADRTYDVSVTNILQGGVAVSHAYAVTLFDGGIKPPGAPTGVSAAPGNGQATVSWSAPASNGGGPVTLYTVTGSPGGRTCVTSGTSSCTVTGLANGTAYNFTVVASNVAGPGPSSAASNPVTPARPPDAPTAVSATGGNGRATVSWTAPVSNGGATVTGYRVTGSPGGQTCVTSGTSSCVVTGLANGTGYTFTVVASNAIGTGPASQASNTVVPVGPPGAPVGVVATSGIGEAAVAWSAPASNGGAPVTGYTVTGSPGGQTCVTSGSLSCTVTGLSKETSYTFTVVAANVTGPGAASVPSNPAVPGSAFHPLSPARILDSRPAGPQVGPYGVPWGPNQSREVTVAGVGGVPAGADAVVLNVTVTGTTGAGYLTIWPAGQAQPVASSLNWAPGQTIPNAVTVKVGAGGKILVFNAVGSANVIVDVVGFYDAIPGDGFTALSPARILDSRPAGPQVGPYGVPWGPNQSREVTVAGVGGVPAGADAVVLNVTVTGTTGAGYLTIWPAGQAQPVASSLNWAPGQTIPNAVTVKVGAGGKISVFNAVGSANVIVDVVGSFAPGTGLPFHPLAPVRIQDSRPGSPVGPYATPWGPGISRNVQVTGAGGVPSGASAVLVNLTATGTTAGSYLTVWPAGAAAPLASSLNWAAGATIPNSVTSKLGPTGGISVRNAAGDVHVLVDTAGWYG